jgi:dTDP-4-dehydrorhamnose 3,5-epimerase
MNLVQTPLAGLVVIEPKVWNDPRGFFFESYNEQTFRQHGIDHAFVQDNQSFSGRGVLRGLHFQRPPFAQCKLVHVLAGEILDVAVDLRSGSPTFGQSFSLLMSAENKKQLLIPHGFAHGFLVLSPTAHVFYKCDQFYSREHDGGVRFDDPDLNISWGAERRSLILSDKDQALPTFAEYRQRPVF